MIFKKANNLDVFPATLLRHFFLTAFLLLVLCTHTDVKRGRFGSSKHVHGPKQFHLCHQALLQVAEQKVRLLQVCYQHIPMGLYVGISLYCLCTTIGLIFLDTKVKHQGLKRDSRSH